MPNHDNHDNHRNPENSGESVSHSEESTEEASHTGHNPSHEQAPVEQSLLEDEAQISASAHGEHGEHAGHGVSHVGHEQMFKKRFFVSLILSIPVLLYSEGLQELLSFSVPAFPGSE